MNRVIPWVNGIERYLGDSCKGLSPINNTLADLFKSFVCGVFRAFI